MAENGSAPRRISTAAASGGHSPAVSDTSSAALDVEAIRRTIERSQEFGLPAKPAQPAKAPAAAQPGARRPAAAPAKQDTAPLIPTARMFYDQDRDPDFPPQRAAAPRHRARGRKKPVRRGDVVLLVLTFLFSVVLLVSGGVLVKRYLDDRKTQEDFADLQTLLPAPAPAADADAAPAPDRFAALQAQNPDCVGWIRIPYTELSYPVMYTPAQPNYYLKHAFDGTYSDYGVPYLDEDCTLTADGHSNNLIIYGHNMKTGIIFGPLTGYLQQDFYTVHPTVQLDTLYDSAEYEVFAAFEIDVVDDPGFVYNEYYDMDEETFDWFVAEVKRRSPVDSGITPVYGEDLLTLSTCEYDTANGRLVVCARRAGAAA